jgi:type II secretory ATPase GspE/PulE/Tfp pilus assembly ATPase PilB-like protein
MEEYPLTKDEYEMIYTDFGEKYWAQAGIEYDADLTLFRTVGCDSCSNTGYRGRMGIHELMEGTPKVKLMIKKQATTEQIFAQAMKDGMSTLRQDGIMKVFKGWTDMTEVRRVCIN